ncbi:GNAT family N-acetyltransferase [Salipaludibacillus aurantiacus]|uniref:Acetyltransferase (GNAT) domain-containing protein n=1 Tax=Salipaludibacillus aurantiacus TaxID=1601833 RepID=A0A1H9TRY8_9BACI|nr:GNAT family protein [Salipaludibacillus aurantiacus]SER99794.1 Acetyltransferase (GNAT) domain-containing protein [Salipaludibacillus aurantiacus]
MNTYDKPLFSINEMTLEAAESISKWTYDYPYELYSMDGSEEIISALLKEGYYLVSFTEVPYFGYFCLGEEARVPGGYEAGIYLPNETHVIDLGLGIHPEWTGKGYGPAFMASILKWIRSNREVSDVRLVVAAFNERAIRLYKKAGFVRHDLFYTRVGAADIPFISMVRPGSKM